MSTPPINLNELEYQQIYDNIRDYIKTKSDFSDFNFEGSALSSIIDILAYNTHYHMLFQNILVNEMFLDSAQKLESLVSHAKLHGYAIQNRYSASATLKLTSIPTTSGAVAYSRLTAKKTDNTILNFYNIEDILAETVDGAGEATFTVYEAHRAVIDQRFDVNIDKQSCFIPDINLDLRTLRVFVDNTEYIRGNSTDSNIYENQNVYFIENVTTGFDIIFASKIVGTALNTDAVVTVSYLVSSGSSGNGASNFSFVNTPDIPLGATTTIAGGILNSLSASSSGGRATGSSDTLKFLIPRTFSSQNRFVTKADIISGVYDAGFASSTSNVTVAADSVTPGKVLISTDFADEDPTEQVKLIEFCNTKSVLGVVFEYGI